MDDLTTDTEQRLIHESAMLLALKAGYVLEQVRTGYRLIVPGRQIYISSLQDAHRTLRPATSARHKASAGAGCSIDTASQKNALQAVWRALPEPCAQAP